MDGARRIFDHLAANQFLTHRVSGNRSWIAYGPLTLKIARNA